MGERYTKKGYGSLDGRRNQTIDFIVSLSREHCVNKLCQLFEVPRSSYFYSIKHRDDICPTRLLLIDKAKKIHEVSRGAAGARSIAGALSQAGYSVGRYKAAGLMKAANIQSKQPNKHKYKIAEDESKIAPNMLNRDFNVSAPNQAWCGDVTYIWAGTQWLYLAAVIDLYSRRIVGWACSNSPDSNLTVAALRMAYESRGNPKNVMFHSDQGCHYTSKKFRESICKYQMVQSMSRRGNCWDNAVMERFFRSFKTEWMPKHGYKSYLEAESDTLQYILQHYNTVRGHSYNNYLSPTMAEERFNAPIEMYRFT